MLFAEQKQPPENLKNFKSKRNARIWSETKQEICNNNKNPSNLQFKYYDCSRLDCNLPLTLVWQTGVEKVPSTNMMFLPGQHRVLGKSFLSLILCEKMFIVFITD
jgi:hypothetical protein